MGKERAKINRVGGGRKRGQVIISNYVMCMYARVKWNSFLCMANIHFSDLQKALRKKQLFILAFLR